MLKSPKKTKYKAPHLHFGNKGLKGYKNSPNAVLIKTKEDNLMSPQPREVCPRILSRSKKPLQTRMGKGKGKDDNGNSWLKTSASMEVTRNSYTYKKAKNPHNLRKMDNLPKIKKSIKLICIKRAISLFSIGVDHVNRTIEEIK